MQASAIEVPASAANNRSLLNNIIEALEMFTLFQALRNHADEFGQVTATDNEMVQWSNEYLHERLPLTSEQECILSKMLQQHGVSHTFAESLVAIARIRQFSVADLWTVVPQIIL